MHGPFFIQYWRLSDGGEGYGQRFSWLECVGLRIAFLQRYRGRARLEIPILSRRRRDLDICWLAKARWHLDRYELYRFNA